MITARTCEQCVKIYSMMIYDAYKQFEMEDAEILLVYNLLVNGS